MNRAETALLLAKIQAYDNRTVGEATVEAWHEALEDLRLEDAKQAAAAYYRRSREFLMPVDIRSAVSAIRRQRIDDTTFPQPPTELDSDDIAAYIAWRRATTRAIADGTYVEAGSRVNAQTWRTIARTPASVLLPPVAAAVIVAILRDRRRTP